LREEFEVRKRRKPWRRQGFLLRGCGIVVIYLLDLRRALMRARAETKNAPAEPTTARIAVGFSGEFSQPPCAWSGRATVRRRAKPKNESRDFFIDGLQLARYLQKSQFVNEERLISVVPFEVQLYRDFCRVEIKMGRYVCQTPDIGREIWFFAGAQKFLFKPKILNVEWPRESEVLPRIRESA
jgi:hypothetical protein